MASQAAVAAVSATVSGDAAALVGPLEGLLKFGVPGLALAIMIVCYVSLQFLQREALAKEIPRSRIEPFERLQKLFLWLSFAIFCVSLVVPPMIGHFFPSRLQSATHKVSFSISPTTFERDELAPLLVITGVGQSVPLRLGTGQDTVQADKGYTVVVERLVKEIADLRVVSVQLREELAHTLGGVDAAGNR